MALLPWGLHRILGITVFLDIPPWLPKLLTAAGGTLIAAGALTAVAHLARHRNHPHLHEPTTTNPAGL